MGGVLNKVVVAVPHQYSFIVERFGKFEKVLKPGLNFLIPLVQNVSYQHSLKEQSFQVKAQNAVTKDNVIMQTDGVLYLRVKDPVKCSYGAKDPINYMYILAQGVMRSEIGKLTLDQTFEEREKINNNILENLTQASEKWGIECLRYEIRDIKVSEAIRKVMNLEAESERRKRAEILKSEGKKTSQINIAEAIRKSHILEAEGRSSEIMLNAEAQVQRINYIATALQAQKELGQENQAAKYLLARQYIDSLGELAHPSKNLLLQNNLSDPQFMVNSSLDLLNQKQPENNTSSDNNAQDQQK